MYPPSRVWERVRVLFERAIKSYFVDTLTENQICHPILAAVPLKIRFRDFNLFIRTSKAGFIFYSVLKKNSYFCNLTSSACRSILKATSSLIMIADISVSQSVRLFSSPQRNPVREYSYPILRKNPIKNDIASNFYLTLDDF